ncbi:MAG: hypothetical protein GXZ13_01030 [Synergistaceae bacterium]|mgnify:CR=1 FL=1|jgi:4-diphosphocytidyl-2-C-methyl-D-erythritol kinase|nr:hypothetical protein [Synergistaceae bacterium]
MRQSVFCPIKFNLTLRVLAKKDDGYHEICSLFWKKKGLDRLTITDISDDNVCDKLTIKGFTINNTNILMKTIFWARSLGCKIPPLQLELEKNMPIGSGIGGGSGNAAALILLLKKYYGLKTSNIEISKLGSDIPFLCGESDMAEVRGIGEKIEDINHDLDFVSLLVFPKWEISTVEAYSKVDTYWQGNFSDKIKANQEVSTILGRLKRGEKIGLLPNDFFEPILEEHQEYDRAQKIAEDSDALAWGLSGSGSAFFALYKNLHKTKLAQNKFKNEYWVKQINILE